MKMRKSHVFVLAALILLLVCAFAVTAMAAGDFVENPTDATILVRYAGTDAVVTIPNTFKTIGADAFKGNTNLIEIRIPDSITGMGAGAFENCKNMTTVTWLGTSKLEVVPARAFKNCASLDPIVIPRTVTSIGDEAFYGCISLRDVMGPDVAYQGSNPYQPVSGHVTSIGSNAFGNCPKAAIQCFKGSAVETYANENNLNKVVVDPIVYSIEVTRKPFVIIWDPTNSAQVQMTVTLDPSFASTDSLGYSSGNQDIVAVSATGLLTPKAPGTCMFTVYSIRDNNIFDEVRVVVLDDRLGWQQWDGAWYYCKSRTEFAIGWNKIGANWYYFNAAGQMQTGWFQDGGTWYYLNPQTGAMQTGWLNLPANSTTWYYLNGNGAMATGWIKLNNKWFYLAGAADPNFPMGQMYFGGTYVIAGDAWTFDNNGVLVNDNGWQYTGGNWYYFSGSRMHKGWLEYKKNWYFLDKTTGAMVTGWLQDNGKWYHMCNSGEMETGWRNIGGKWYFFNNSGAMVTGWLKSKNVWYWLSKDEADLGAMATGWINDGGLFYYLKADGAMVTGWQKIGNEWYYFNPSGAMVRGWYKEGNTWYYLFDDGVMATGTVIIDGVTYTFSSSGALQ